MRSVLAIMWRQGLILTLALFLAVLFSGIGATAEVEAGWRIDGDIALSTGAEADPNLINLLDNDCFPATFKIQKYGAYGNLPNGSTNWLRKPDHLTQVCALQTPLGLVAQLPTGTYVQFSGTNYAQRLSRGGAGGLWAYPVPGQRTLVVQDGSSSSYAAKKTRINYNIVAAGDSIIEGGERVFKLNSYSYPDPFLDSSGNTLEFSYIAFSQNGEWMVAVVRGVLMRIHIPTKAMQTFGKSYAGGGMGYNFAISNDGNYVLAQENYRGDGVPWLYDLEHCVPNQQYGFGSQPAVSEGCLRRDLSPMLKQAVNGYRALNGMRFSFDGQVLHGYVSFMKTPTLRAWKSIKIMAKGYTEPSLQYLAMGDSFASGEGDTEGGEWYEPGTDTALNKCHISRRSYPYLVSTQLGLHTGINQSPGEGSPFRSIACSGAVTRDVVSLEENYAGQVKDKVLRKDRDAAPILGDFSPGYIAQKEFLEQYHPPMVTISTIGNDIGFSDKIMRCLAPDTCYSTYEDRLEILKEIQNKFGTMTGMYQQLKAAAGDNSKIFVLGYPQMFYPGGSCAANVRLDRDELHFAYHLTRFLNASIKAATEYAGVRYVDVENAFAGKEHCAGPTETLAVNGLTLGSDTFFGIIGNESFHPNSLGHERYAKRVMDETAGFTEPMPYPDGASTAPDPLAPEFAAFFEGALVTGRALNDLNYNESSDDNVHFVYSDQLLRMAIEVVDFGLRHSSTYSLWLNSEPVHLGDFVSGADGVLQIKAAIPVSVPPGLHTLHIYGQNLAGENVDIYRMVYVAANETDYDGDGIPNDQEPCLVWEASGEDRDKDGVDDACDGYIGLPPVEKDSDPDDHENDQDSPGNNYIPPQSRSGAAINLLGVPVAQTRDLLIATSTPGVPLRQEQAVHQFAALSATTLGSDEVQANASSQQSTEAYKLLFYGTTGVFLAVAGYVGILRAKLAGKKKAI